MKKQTKHFFIILFYVWEPENVVLSILTLEHPDFAAPQEPPASVKLTHIPFLRYYLLFRKFFGWIGVL